MGQMGMAKTFWEVLHCDYSKGGTRDIPLPLLSPEIKIRKDDNFYTPSVDGRGLFQGKESDSGKVSFCWCFH